MSRKKPAETGDTSTTVADTPKYRHMTFFEAAERRRITGIEEHGNVYDGDPVDDILQELCDANNYLSFAERMGHNAETIERARTLLVEVSAVVREMPPIEGIIETDW